MIMCAILRLFQWCLVPQIPLETNLSGCKTSLMSLWISAMLDNLAMDPPAISCHEDQFPHVVKQINTTRKLAFFSPAERHHRPPMVWVSTLWERGLKAFRSCDECKISGLPMTKYEIIMWNHDKHVFLWKTQKSWWHCSYLYSKSYPKNVDRFGRDMSNMSSTMIIPFWLPKYKPRLC